MAEVTLRIEDNPLAGMAGQPDIITTVSSDPPLPMPGSAAFPDPDDLTPAQCSALMAILAVTEMSERASFMHLDLGSSQ
jgi:hypothetical protein